MDVRRYLCRSTWVWVPAIILGLQSQANAGIPEVTVRFDPPLAVVGLGDNFAVDVVADIAVPVVGWGLDLTIDMPSIASLDGPPAVSLPPWVPAATIDGDDLAGLADPLAPVNGSVSGGSIVLATLNMSADTVGDTDLFASFTLGDLTEGFALETPLDFADVGFEPGHVTVVPEPMSWTVLALGLAIALRRRQRR